MKYLGLYKWLIGSMSDFCKPFQNNERLYNQAKSFWNQLESSSAIVIVIFIVLGLLLAISYYKPFNDQPHRHYKPRYWFIFWGGTILLSFVVTIVFLYISHEPKLQGSLILELKIAFANSLYAGVIYLLVSWVWCQFNLPTNAYRLIKF